VSYESASVDQTCGLGRRRWRGGDHDCRVLLDGVELGHTTTRLVAEGSESAVIAVLTPFCVANYMKQPDAAKHLALLREDTSSYTQREIIEKAGFATMPGNQEPSSGVAAACEIALRTPTKAASK
jgi:hypothetical protein